LGGPLRRIIRWYLAPSGLLLAVALIVSTAAVVLRQPWLGLGAIALMGVFLPYRLSRQQGYAEERLMAEVARLRVHHEHAEAHIARNTDLIIGLSELGEIVHGMGPQVDSIAMTQADFTKMRLILTARLDAVDARLDELSARETA